MHVDKCLCEKTHGRPQENIRFEVVERIFVHTYVERYGCVGVSLRFQEECNNIKNP